MLTLAIVLGVVFIGLPLAFLFLFLLYATVWDAIKEIRRSWR